MAYVVLSFLIQFPSRQDELRKKSRFKRNLSHPDIPDLGAYKDLLEPKNFVLPSKHKNYCHIYYLITPARIVHVSIVELDDVAVIGTKDHKAAVRTIKLPGGTFVAFSIVHKIAIPVDVSEVLDVHAHKIEFQVTQEAKDLLPEVLKDKTKLFLKSRTGEEDEYIFEELKRFENETVVVSNFKQSLAFLAEERVEPGEASVVLRPVPSEVHLGDIARRLGESEIMAISSNSLLKTGVKHEGLGLSDLLNMGQKKKIRCKQIRSKKKLEQTLIFTGQQLLYDKRTWKLEKRDVSKDILSLNVWCYTTNLLSESIRKEMIPFGIYVKKLVNLPKELSPDKITLSYSLGEIIRKVEIKAKELIENRAVFNDVKLFFIKQSEIETIFSSLQTSPLIIKISATKKRDILKHQINPHSYSFGFNFDKLSTRIVHRPVGDDIINDLRKDFTGVVNEKSKDEKKLNHNGKKNGFRIKKSDEEVFLGYVTVDCSSFTYENFRLSLNLPVSRYYHLQPLESNAICEHFDSLRLHEVVTPGETGTVEEGKFVSLDTYLKIKLQLSGLPSLDSPEMEDVLSDTLRRVVIITREYGPLKRVIERIIKLNSDVQKNKNFTYPWKPYWHVRKAGQLTVPENYPSLLCALTGFVVRMPSTNLLVAEGIGGLSLPTAFEDVFSLPSSEGRVLYNSKIIFPERLYNDFLPFGGIFMIDMKVTITEIIARMKESLLSRNFPPLAFKALMKLDRLIQCSNIQRASVRNYFPSVQELVSFEHEFGVPALKKCKDSPRSGKISEIKS